jgi:hypothetical protein
MIFKEFENGLYFYDAAENNSCYSKNEIKAYSFILSVESNKNHFHRREIESADLARALYKTIGRPSQQVFEHILNKNLIRNCPVTTADAKRAVFIYGPDTGSSQGKLTRQASEHVPTLATISLCVDIFYVNQMLFFSQYFTKIKDTNIE